MSPEGRAWAERKIAAWSRRAAELRARPDERGALRRAEGLEFLVDGLAARIAEPAAGEADEQAALRARLACCQPRLHPETRIPLNHGPLMDAVRAELSARLSGLADGAPSPEPPMPPPRTPPAQIALFA